MEALKGAEKSIRNYHPKLAISIYHKLEDVDEIPRLLLEYYPDYKFYLRHYSLMNCETILYALQYDYAISLQRDETKVVNQRCLW